MKTVVTLWGSWADRRVRAVADLEAAREAPGLFKPEWTERAETEFDRANAECRRWSREAVGSL